MFGEPVTVTPSGGSPVAGRGIFANRAINDDVGDTEVTRTVPVLSVRLSEFPVTPVQGLAIEVRSVAYEVDNILPDGQGAADLVLKEPG